MPMPNVSVLPSYDFYGKTIPGIFLILGVIPLLERVPNFPNLESVAGLNLPLLAAILLALAFIGLVVGQLIHAISVNVEKILYWGGHSTHDFYYEHLADRILPVFSDERLAGAVLSALHLKLLWKVIRPWMIRRYWGLQDVFKSHRRLFENSLGWHFDKGVSKRQAGGENLIYHGFRAAFDNHFDISPYEDLAEFGIDSPKYEEFRQLYPLVASEVSKRSGGRASEFYSRYSFCRGMWVTLLILLSVYSTVVVFDIPGIDYTPLLLQLSTSSRIMLFSAIIVSIAVFLEASGEYKRHYVDYLITEFFAEYGKQVHPQQ